MRLRSVPRRARALRRSRLDLEPLESRLLLHVDPLTGHQGDEDVLDPGILATSAPIELPLDDGNPDGFGGSAGPVPVSSVPSFSSLPGAHASLYLDFNGFYEGQWGDYRNITTPVFDQDGNPTTFSDSEQAAIRAIWSYVAEDYAPFNINVTTVEPPSIADGVAQRIAIGGDGLWLGSRAGGVSYVDSFTDSSLSNTSYVFSKNLTNGNAKYVADATSHEAGHAFGIYHQSQYSTLGIKLSEYYAGPGDGRAPIMGNSYSATRSLWWYGTSTSSRTYQDDMALIASANGFGYRADDHGNTATTASPLSVSGNQVSAAGVISKTSDVDYFSFLTGSGSITLSVAVAGVYANLDARIELRSAGGALIASAAPTGSLGATITATVTAGSYRLVVASNGQYGDIGQYTVGGTIQSGFTPVDAPASLTAVLDSGAVVLSWSDRANSETGFAIERTTDGVNWQVVGQAAANETAWTDSLVAPGGTYSYRVQAYNAAITSDYSNEAGVTLAPVAPAVLTVTVVSSSRIDLTWSEVAGAAGYVIERSLDGTNWTQIGTATAGVRSYSSTGLSASTKYVYRVRAVNAGGTSPASPVASETTLAPTTSPTPDGQDSGGSSGGGGGSDTSGGSSRRTRRTRRTRTRTRRNRSSSAPAAATTAAALDRIYAQRSLLAAFENDDKDAWSVFIDLIEEHS